MHHVAGFGTSRSSVSWAARVASVAALVTTQTLIATPATAQSQQRTNSVLAEALFREGRELMDRDRVAEACAKFAESYRLDRALGTLLNLAVCHEKEGKIASAWSEYSDAAAEAATEKDDRAAFASKKAAALLPELPRVQLAIAPATSSVASLEIQVDKSKLGRDAWSSLLPIDPGEHELVASAEGKKPFRTVFNVPKGVGTTNVNVPALEEAPKPPPAAVDASGASGAREGGSAQRTVGWILAGVGVVGLGVGGGFGLLAMSKKSDREDGCDPTGACTSDGLDADRSARDAALVSTIGFAAGGALLAGGVVLLLTAPSNKVRVGTTGRTLFVGGTF